MDATHGLFVADALMGLRVVVQGININKAQSVPVIASPEKGHLTYAQRAASVEQHGELRRSRPCHSRLQ